jgi:hypothetical protein
MIHNLYQPVAAAHRAECQVKVEDITIVNLSSLAYVSMAVRQPTTMASGCSSCGMAGKSGEHHNREPLVPDIIPDGSAAASSALHLFMGSFLSVFLHGMVLGLASWARDTHRFEADQFVEC